MGRGRQGLGKGFGALMSRQNTVCSPRQSKTLSWEAESHCGFASHVADNLGKRLPSEAGFAPQRKSAQGLAQQDFLLQTRRLTLNPGGQGHWCLQVLEDDTGHALARDRMI